MEDNGQAMVIRRRPLDDEMWASYKGLELEGAVAAILRIQKYWDICIEHPYVTVIQPDDQGLYVTLFSDLEFLLEQSTLDKDQQTLILGLIPTDGPDPFCAIGYDQEVRSGLEGEFLRAISMLRKEIVRHHGDLVNSAVEPMFDLFDTELDWIAKNASVQSQSWLTSSGFDKPLEQPETAAQNTGAKRGRKTKKIPYTIAQDVYWELHHVYIEDGSTSPPKQEDVCERLADLGHAVSPSTFGRIIKQWRQEGLKWPPPRGASDVFTAEIEI